MKPNYFILEIDYICYFIKQEKLKRDLILDVSKENSLQKYYIDDVAMLGRDYDRGAWFNVVNVCKIIDCAWLRSNDLYI